MIASAIKVIKPQGFFVSRRKRPRSMFFITIIPQELKGPGATGNNC
jgi:hypothetical protein